MSEDFGQFPVDEEIDALAINPARIVFDWTDELGGRGLRTDLEKTVNPRTRSLMSTAGWRYIADGSFGPDPLRFTRAAEASGIPIRLITEVNEIGHIPPKIYAETVELGLHPVGVGGFVSEYFHDVGIDHLPAVAVAGRGLFELLEPGSRKAGDFYDVAEAYDTGTSIISAGLRMYLARLNRTSLYRYRRKSLDYCKTSTSAMLGYSYRESRKRDKEIRRLLMEGLERLELL